MTSYRLFPSTNGPGSVITFSGNFEAGVIFNVSNYMWLEGYWWWAAPGGDLPPAQQFALWTAYGPTSYHSLLIPNSVATMGPQTPGQWNFAPLNPAVLLSPGVIYEATTAWVAVHGFPYTGNQFGAGNPFAAGITNGPLFAYSDQGATAPAPVNIPQGLFSTASPADPSINAAGGGSGSGNFWVDLQVRDAPPPPVTSYRIWPNRGGLTLGINGDENSYTLGTQFSVTQTCWLMRLWWYSPTVATVLPTHAGVWDIATRQVVGNSDVPSPTWLLPGGAPASAGAGWVYVDYTPAVGANVGPILSPGRNYSAAVFQPTPAIAWWETVVGYWGPGGVGASGFTNGPLVVPNEAGSVNGQGSYVRNAWAFPGTDSGSAEVYEVDVEVSILVPPVLVPAQPFTRGISMWH